MLGGVWVCVKTKKQPFSERNFIPIICVIIIFSGLLVAVGVLFGKNLFMKRKVRANELEEMFYYKNER